MMADEGFSVEGMPSLLKFDEETWKFKMGDIEVSAMSDLFVARLQKELERLIGPMGPNLLKMAAREIGLNDGRSIKDINKNLSPLEAISSKAIAVLLCRLGWGKFDRFEMEDDKIIFVRSTSFEGDAHKKLGESDTSCCYFALGYTTGFFEGLLNQKFKSEEIECIGKGDNLCKIIVYLDPSEVGK